MEQSPSTYTTKTERIITSARPVIGIIPTLKINVHDYEQCLDILYTKAILQAGGLPIILPLVEEEITLGLYFDQIDGLLLSGGHDISPELYGTDAGSPSGLLVQETTPLRDKVEMWALSFAQTHNLPVLGICRGLQIINAFYGGTLIEDIPAHAYAHNFETATHREHKGTPIHDIDVNMDTRLGSILREPCLHINSNHHQCVRDLAPGFVESARSSADHLIEAIELNDERFVVAVQWHPEFFSAREAEMRLFVSFVEEALRYKHKIKTQELTLKKRK